MENPFAVVSPDEMTAEQSNQLFVETHSDFPQIKRPGNLIITGARGCGKSMLIRCSMPDVLMLKDGKILSQLDYLAFSVPVKKTRLNLTELQEIKHAPHLINEHFMSTYVLMYSLLNLANIKYSGNEEEAYKSFFEKTYKKYMRLSGCKDEIEVNYSSPREFFRLLYEHAEKLNYDVVDYVKRLQLNTTETDCSYNLPLLSFIGFIVPVFKELIKLPEFPNEKHIFIFIDDADNLSKIQTEILNSWLACRTQPTISLKVSTQIDLYKTYLSSSGVLVESPHDYQEVNISYRYTTNIGRGSNYNKKAKEILEKRLLIAGIETGPDMFFPTYEKQQIGIEEEIKKIKENYATSGRGNKIDDDVRRYAIPNYIKNLGGNRKSRSTYRYAGLENIIHISSGIVRNLLDAVTMMYDDMYNYEKKEKRSNPDPPVNYIDTSIQDEALRKRADQILYTELKKLEHKDPDFELAPVPIPSPANDPEKLQNLISAMGRTFHEILVSDRSERKVFSVALTNIPDSELKSVFRLGVRLGFFHELRIGNKDGSGRTMLYVLNRCFAPLFTLDPTGFQGYLFMTNDDLHKAIKDGKQLRQISAEIEDAKDLRQLTLDDEIWGD